MHPTQPFIVVFALLLVSQPVRAQEARRQLDAHAHGSGTLAIALEGNRLQMELEAPASDIVGFEHAPSSASQTKAIADAKTRLAKLGDVFKLSPEAGCKLGSATVEVLGAAAVTGKAGAQAQGHNHGTPSKGDGKTADKAGEKSGAAGQHSEFRATYGLDCANPGALRSIGFDYFKTFKGAQKLAVTVIGPKGQTQSVVTRAKPVLDLGGTS